uniref:VWFD domain-containing protein n=1 Tax=Falco tinnunculus TaxID=100819 RepID=A0A8C4TVU3_FALTI
CLPNSHFEACGTACPATCTNPKAPTSCSKPCAASCQCDEGFVLHGEACVPAETCRCFHNSRSYQVHEEFWEDGSCQSRCRCEVGGKVACRKAGCKAHQKCIMVDGVPSCQANKYFTCIGTGDPHYTTFDGLRYDFQGTCVYQFAALCTQDPQLTPFTIKVENNNRGSKAVSFTKTVTLEVYGNVISMSQEHPRKVNGALVELPFSQKGQFEVYHSGVHGFVHTIFGLRVSFDWYSYARVILPDAYAGAVCGLCGNANGNADDDFVTRDGQRAADEIQLANSWKVGEVPGCSTGCVGDCPVCKEEQKRLYRGDGYCGVIAKAGGPFRACHRTINPAPFLEDCAFDACHYKGHRDTLCKAIASYVMECQSQGITVEPWRTPSFCPSCPRHSHYELCGSSCPATCRGPASPGDCASVLCIEGCFCNEGFVLSGDECVPAGECGCEHQGRYYKKGEVFYTSCRERCRCQAKGVVECEEVFCSTHEECRVEDGVLGCYPAGYGRLVVSGDPHYLTFDGRAFHLLGSCTYVLAQLCKPDPRLTNFSVLLKHDMGGRGNVALMKKVVISIHEKKKLRIVQEGNNIVLQTAAGLRLLYNVATYLLVTIPDAYRGRVCGLGGNYNGDPGDDFQLPGGSLAQSTEEFITSWKVPMEDGACTEGCNGKDCTACDTTETAPYSVSDSCGLIRDPAGPFGPCHPRVSPVEYYNHCLHDVCAANGASDVLCHSLQAYATACQAAAAEIGGWRTTTFCPLSCPPHSHYELCTRTCDFTCASLSMPAPCSWTCFEGCQCDDGYLFDGEACVSLEQCGCMHQGRYFRAHETIISNNCSTKCSCHPSRGLICEDVWCPPDEVCTRRDGAQLCVKREGRCRVSPGASLTTFDGTRGDLLTSGTYKVAALCNEQSPNWFKVVVEVSECRDDNIPAAVAIFVFFLSKAVSLSVVAGNITISHTLGMDVLFSPGGEMTITVGATLVNQLCAPCGNFNGDPSDDLKLPDGRTSLCGICGDAGGDTSSFARTASICGRLVQGDLLRMCQGVVDPWGFLEGCMGEGCSGGGSTCEALASYADACEERGVQVPGWRRSEGCALSCPPNSRYNPCGCPRTCSHPDGPENCSTTCQETCECAQGFVVLNGICVAAEVACGCLHAGHRYGPGQHFWEDENCTHRCNCDPQEQRVRCWEDRCHRGEWCSMENGVTACHPETYRRCSAGRDLRYVTFDGQHYGFGGTCPYEFARACRASEGVVGFQVWVQNWAQEGRAASFARSVHIVVYGYNVTLSYDFPGRAMVRVPMGGVGGGFSIARRGWGTSLRTDFHLTVSFDGRSHLAVTVPSAYAGALCGLCGNFDGDPHNDVPEVVTVPAAGCGEPAPRRCASRAIISRKQRGNGEECGLILLAEGPFRACHPHLDPESYFQACVTDYCIFRGHKAIVCLAVTGYAAACQEAGVVLEPWRSKTFCGRWSQGVARTVGRRESWGFGSLSKPIEAGTCLGSGFHQRWGQEGDGSIFGGGKAQVGISIPTSWRRVHG